MFGTQTARHQKPLSNGLLQKKKARTCNIYNIHRSQRWYIAKRMFYNHLLIGRLIVYIFKSAAEVSAVLWWPGCVISHLFPVALIYLVNPRPKLDPSAAWPPLSSITACCHWEWCSGSHLFLVVPYRSCGHISFLQFMARLYYTLDVFVLSRWSYLGSNFNEMNKTSMIGYLI